MYHLLLHLGGSYVCNRGRSGMNGQRALLTLVLIIAMRFPRARHMTARFAGMELAGVLANQHPLYWMGFLRAPHVMTHFAGTDKTGSFGAIICSGHRFFACRTGTLVAVAMSCPRAQCVMAHFAGRMIPRIQYLRGIAGHFRLLLLFFCDWEKAWVFLNYHPLRAGAVVRWFRNRHIFHRAGVYLSVQNEPIDERCTETSRHNYHATV